MQALYIYLAIINAVGFVIMHVDKQKAKKKRWRIPEKTLLGIAAIGGSLGSLLAMQLFRHKTKHIAFAAGIPVMLAVHVVILIFILMKL